MLSARFALAIALIAAAWTEAVAAVTTFPVGPGAAASAPVAVAIESSLNRAYVVQRQFYADVQVNVGIVPTDRVTALDLTTGNVLAVIPIGATLNGQYQGIAADSTRHRIYVTNPDANSVTIIDATTNTVSATTTLTNSSSAQPQGIGVDPDLGLVFVACGGTNRAGSVTVLDAATGGVRTTVATGGSAVHIAVDRSTHTVYATIDASPWTVVAIDEATQTIKKSVGLSLLLAASGITVDAGSTVYVSFYTSKAVSLVDISKGTAAMVETTRWLNVGQGPRGVAVDPTTHVVYAADSGANQTLLWSGAGGGSQVKAINVLQRPTAVTVDAASNRAYVTDASSNSLSVINTTTQALLTNLPLAAAPTGVAYDATAQRLYATNFLTDTIAVVNPATRAVLSTWSTGSGPWALAVDPALKQLYSLNNGGTGSLTVLSTVDGHLLSSTSAMNNLGTVHVVTASATTHRVFVTAGNTVTAFDGTTLNKLGAFSVAGTRAAGLALDDASNRIYVAAVDSGAIVVLNATTLQVTDTWPARVGSRWSLALDSANRRLYATVIANSIGAFGGVEVLNADTGASLAQIAAAADSDTVAVNPTTRALYATSPGSNTVTVFDGANNVLSGNVTVGSRPRDLVADPASGLVYVGNVFDGTISIVDATIAPTAPVITTQPQSQTVSVGGTISLTVAASGTAPLSYRWFKAGTAITGATNATLTITPAQLTDAAGYSVVVSNAAGSASSDTATATVLNPGRIVNLSIRSTAGTGAQTLIVGFAVAGDGKSLLVRSIGPGLAAYSVPGRLADPQVTLYPTTGAAIAANDNWGTAANASQIAATATQVGAFALAPDSLDAALLTTLNAGSYTAQTVGAGTTTGVALVELYDANSAATARLTNVSARTQVGTGDNILIAGFTITGGTKKTVLIRAIGPSLANFGVTGALRDPLLQVFRNGNSTAIATNDNWDGTTATATAFTQVGAFPLTPGSADSALLLTLDPGGYTAQVSGVGNATGVGLVEVYDVN